LRTNTKDEDLPPVLTGLGRSMKLAYKAEPRLLIVSFTLIVLSWLPDAFGALWLKQLVNGVDGDDSSVVTRAVIGLAAAAAAGWLLRTIGSRIEQRFRDRATIELEAHVAHLQATVASIEHHERPALLDRLQLLREQVFLLNHIYAAVFDGIGSVGRLAITVVLLMSISPVLVLLAAFAIPPIHV
jgi:ATP-binding cassette subfamily B protein